MKLNKIKEWVEKGMVVKIVMKMKGREKTQPDLVLQKCKSIIRETEEKYPKIELKDKIYNQPNNFHFFLCKKR